MMFFTSILSGYLTKSLSLLIGTQRDNWHSSNILFAVLLQFISDKCCIHASVKREKTQGVLYICCHVVKLWIVCTLFYISNIQLILISLSINEKKAHATCMQLWWSYPEDSDNQNNGGNLHLCSPSLSQILFKKDGLRISYPGDPCRPTTSKHRKGKRRRLRGSER